MSKNDGECEDCTCAENEYSLIQYNFSLFFGIASSSTRRRSFLTILRGTAFVVEHPNSSDPNLNPWTNLTPSHISRFALFGAHLFNDRTRGPQNIRCSNCHEQNELTGRFRPPHCAALNGPVRNRDGNVIDKGFNNIGIRPTDNDLGVGASDVFGPSHSRAGSSLAPTPNVRPGCCDQGFRVQGAFKIPSLWKWPSQRRTFTTATCANSA